MLAILQAVDAKFAASPELVAAFPGGIHRDIASKGAPYPYIASGIAASVRGQWFGGAAACEATARLTGWGVESESLTAAMATFIAVFDGFVPPLAIGAVLNVVRRSEPTPILTPEKDEDGYELWRADVLYDYSIQST